MLESRLPALAMVKSRALRSPAPLGHRTRVGRERRARTLERILAAAVEVFGRDTYATPVIDEFIKAAGLSRGSFYNYFKSTEELLQATSAWLEDQMVTAIVDSMDSIKDPGERLCTGLRLWLLRAQLDPIFCAFVARQRWRGERVEREVTKDLRAGLRTGVIESISLETARDLFMGTAREAMVRMSAGQVGPNYSTEIVRLALRGLGMKEAAIAKGLRRPLPSLDAPSAQGKERGPPE